MKRNELWIIWDWFYFNWIVSICSGWLIKWVEVNRAVISVMVKQILCSVKVKIVCSGYVKHFDALLCIEVSRQKLSQSSLSLSASMLLAIKLVVWICLLSRQTGYVMQTNLLSLTNPLATRSNMRAGIMQCNVVKATISVQLQIKVLWTTSNSWLPHSRHLQQSVYLLLAKLVTFGVYLSFAWSKVNWQMRKLWMIQELDQSMYWLYQMHCD